MPYQVVVGEGEVQGEVVSLRLRYGRRLGDVALDDLLHRIVARVAARGSALWESA